MVNGAEGVFKYYTQIPTDIVWIEFSDEKFGVLAQASMQHLYTPAIMSRWTPIKRITLHIVLDNKRNIMRAQFPIQLACARTIHRAQGLTMDRLAFDPKGIRRHGLIYTALSRVKYINCLYLLNKLDEKIHKLYKSRY